MKINASSIDPRVSIVMPAYNAAAHIGSAIASVLDQDFTSLELVIVNDGSSDRSADIAASFADPRISVISQSNHGECAARNAALDIARGDYVGFLDADDTYLPGAIGRLVSYLDSHKEFGVVYSDGWFVDERGRPLLSFKAHRPCEPEGNVLEPIAVGESVIVSICSTLMRRDVISRHGLRFDTSLRIGGDWDFWIRTARVAEFGYMDSPTCRYSVHGGNVTVATDQLERRRNLARVRRGVMESDWFDDLALASRVRIARNLLVGVQTGDSPGQRATIGLASFGRLPAHSRAKLLRWVALDHVKTGDDLAFAVECLSQAVRLDPTSVKSQLARALLRASPRLTVIGCVGWTGTARLARRGSHKGVRPTEPPPAALHPSRTAANDP